MKAILEKFKGWRTLIVAVLTEVVGVVGASGGLGVIDESSGVTLIVTGILFGVLRFVTDGQVGFLKLLK